MRLPRIIHLGPRVEPDTDARTIRSAAGRIRAACNAGNLGLAAAILRSYAPDDRDRIAALLELRTRRPLSAADAEDLNAVAGAPMDSVHPRGQALVETALVMPILLLVIVGGVMLSLAMLDRANRTWEAQEAALAAATAGAEDSACQAALEAVAAIGGASHADCAGSDGLTMSYDPAAEPPTVTITLDGGRYPVPFGEPVTVRADATAIIREEAP
jgi:hypothetical protein